MSNGDAEMVCHLLEESEKSLLVMRVGSRIAFATIDVAEADLQSPLEEFVARCITPAIAAMRHRLKDNPLTE